MDQSTFQKLARPSGRLVLVSLLWVLTIGMSEESCRIERPPDTDSPMMVRHLVGNCSDDERKALAISAQEVLEAIAQGQGIQLTGVMLTGDLQLDALSLVPIPENFPLPPLVKERFERERLAEVRIIQGPIRFHQVDVQDIVATNLVNQGYVIFKQPVSMTNSIVRRSIDFSRAVFLGEVDFSETTIRHEGFFIRALFLQNADFRQTAFGTHTRFHKAVFAGEARFTKAGFHGLGEFLEVEFLQKADFSSTHFGQGTGFSGSQFADSADFSDATFDGEIFFRFTQFGKQSFFRSGLFRKTADFTEATFGGDTDFSEVEFAEPPQFTDETVAAQFRPETGWLDSQNRVGVFVLAGLILLFFYYLFRRTEGHGSK